MKLTWVLMIPHQIHDGLGCSICGALAPSQTVATVLNLCRFLSAVINSVYSFWWDVTNDWGLELLKIKPNSTGTVHRTPPRQLILPRLQTHLHSSLLNYSSPESAIVDATEEDHWPSIDRATNPHRRSHPWGLRPWLLYPLSVYPLLVFLNLILRMTWSIKLSSHLHTATEGGVGIFWLEVAELFRRWLWVFLRVEWEVVKKFCEGNSKRQPDDVDSIDEYEMASTISEEQPLLNA